VSSTRVLYLFADDAVVARREASGGRAVARLSGVLKLGPGSPPSGERGVLSLQSPGATGAREVDALGLYPAPGAGVVSHWKHTIALRELGVHAARWSFGDAQSNRVELRVADEPPPAGPALVIEAIGSAGVAHEPDLRVRLCNVTDRPLDRADALFGCAAIVDGARARYRVGTYHGAAELAPGEAMSVLVSLDAFDPRCLPRCGSSSCRAERRLARRASRSCQAGVLSGVCPAAGRLSEHRPKPDSGASDIRRLAWHMACEASASCVLEWWLCGWRWRRDG
jgi:hypothetical protein